MPQLDAENRECGYLEVDESDKRKKFQRRYVVLNKSKGLLEWYLKSPEHSNGEVTPCGVIKLGYITKVDIATRVKLEYCFVINTPFRPYYMQASNQAELEEWVEILNDAGKITVPPEALRPKPTEEGEQGNESSNKAANTSQEQNKNFTYRTEIVGNVVVKKKIKSDGHAVKQKVEAPVSPTFVHGPDSSMASEDLPISYSLNDNSKIENQTGFIKAGWAVKQGHVRKNWKRRYFVLRTDSFSYYKSNNEKEPIRTIPINEVLAAKEETGEASRQRDNLLFVATTDKIYYMQTDTPQEMDDWIAAFGNAIKTNRLESQKKKPPAKDENAAVDGSRAGRPSSRAQRPVMAHSHSASNLIPIVPVLHHMSAAQVDEGIGIGLGLAGRFDSTQDVNNGSACGGGGAQTGLSQKRGSALSVSSSSQDSVAHCSNDSLHRVDHLAKDLQPREGRSVHKRSESVVTILPTHVTGSMFSSIQHGKPMLHYTHEDVAPRPESMHIQPTAGRGKGDYHPPGAATTPSKSHPVANSLDPTVDHRSAVKPSNIKKKKNSGVMFMLNTMLSRKGEKMTKSDKKGKYQVT